MVIGAGDFANAHSNITACISILCEITVPVVMVAGNNETTDELRTACNGWSSAYVLNGNGVTLHGINFFGIGGGIPVTPFGSWSYDFTEEQASELLKDCPPGCVLLSHSPPYGVVDVASQGKHLGSTAVRDAVIRTEPQLVVCGHIHASAGQRDLIGSVPVINAGPKGMLYRL